MKTRKLVALLLTSAMLISFAGCSDNSKEDILDATEDYMDDLFDIDISGFNSEEETQIWRAILNKMDYEIDEDSVDINSQKTRLL